MNPTVQGRSSRSGSLLLSVLALAIFVFASMPLAAPIQAQEDVEGASDHPLISRFEGSWIIDYDAADFDEYRVVTDFVELDDPNGGWLSSEEALTDENSSRLEGRVTRITYRAPETSSTLQITRSYEATLNRLGFTTVHACSSSECTDYRSRFASAVMLSTGRYFQGDLGDVRYLSSTMERGDSDIYVSLLVVGFDEPYVQLDVVEVERLAEGLVTADPAALARDLERAGSVKLEGIYFDTGLASLRDESSDALERVAALLAGDPSLQLFVVGHTDSTGTLEENLQLSRDRAQAVISALITDHGVDGDRLAPHGLGPLAPVAPNTTEEGRAQNRRVMLVVR